MNIILSQIFSDLYYQIQVFLVKKMDLKARKKSLQISLLHTIVLMIFFTQISGCSQKRENLDGKITIVCTTGILADMVMNLVDSSFEVKSLMGPGVDPHLYKATHGDLQLLRSADIIIYNGLFLEGKMAEILEKLNQQKLVWAAAEFLDRSELIQSKDFESSFDPHVWFDVKLWSKVARITAEKLKAQYPEKSAIIQEKSGNYQLILQNLHESIQKEIQEIPAKQRVLITAHDAFSYFGKAYDMEVKGLQGLSTLSESGLRDISDLVKFIIERNVAAVFVETSVSEKAIKSVVAGCKEKGHTVKVGGSLYSDALGEKNTSEGNYIGMVKYNVSTIVNGLK